MDQLDEKLLRAEELFLESADAGEDELDDLLPPLIEAGYVEERPWGETTGWTLWSFTEAGVKRCEDLEAQSDGA